MITWENVDNGSCKRDDFPDVSEPRGQPETTLQGNVVPSEVLVPDELMLPYQPRTTPTGDLDHLSFVGRKPRNSEPKLSVSLMGVTGLCFF